MSCNRCFARFFVGAAEGHYQIPDGEELWKLFLVISLNKIRALGEFHRAAKRSVSQTTQLGSEGELVGDQQNPDERAYGVLKMTVSELLDKLPALQRQMIVMRIEGYGIKQICTRRSGPNARWNAFYRVFAVNSVMPCARSKAVVNRTDESARQLDDFVESYEAARAARNFRGSACLRSRRGPSRLP